MRQIASWVYERQLASRGLPRRFWALCRALLIMLFRDPACVMSVHGRQLFMPLSHALPLYLATHPHYDSLLTRLSGYLAEKDQELICIDVGANIGDTIAAMFRADARFLAIEPSHNYHMYLCNNWGKLANVTTLDAVCSSVSATTRLHLVEKSGTASLEFSDRSDTVSARTLDDIVDAYPVYAHPRVIKIDTDGHDFQVIAGARKVIEQVRPIVLFECDAFGNTKYIEDCLATLAFFESVGYRSFLLYDNLGHLMGRHSLTDLNYFKDLLLYQLTSNFRYFDILMMEEVDIGGFQARERLHFISTALKDMKLSQSAGLLQDRMENSRRADIHAR